MDLALILVSFHSGDPLRRFFASLAAHPIAAPHRVVVVDNAPGDGVGEWLAREHPEVLVVPMDRNVGYAGAVNAGLAATDTPFALVINPDVELTDDGVDRALDYIRQRPQVGLVGARLLNADGSPQRSARRFYTASSILLRRTPLGRFFPDHPELRRHLMLDDDLEQPGPVDWVMGAWMLVRREAVDAVGPMDDRFFLYFEDVDWCYRMWERGYEVHWFPDAAFVHQYQRSSGRLGRSLVHHARSFLSFYDKWGALVYVARRLRGAWETASAVAGDLAVLNLAFLAAFYTRRALAPWFSERLFDLVDYWPIIVFTNVVSLITLPLLGRYGAPASRRRWTRWIDAARAALLVGLIVMAGAYLYHTQTFSRAVVLFFLPYYLVGLEWMRLLRERILGGGRGSAGHVDRVLVLGTGAGAEALATDLDAREGVVVAGHIADAPRPGLRVLGGPGYAHEVIDRYRIHEVVVSGQDDADETGQALAKEIAALGTPVLLAHPWAELASGRETVVHRHGMAFWEVRSPAACAQPAWAKPLLDRPIALLLCGLSLPGFVLCWLLGRPLGLVRSRPVERLGLRRGRLRWRELVWRRSGRPLWGLVQLPLFLQVLLGRLSLVGPYPLPLGLEEELGPVQRLRFAVKPGLSGFWQHHLESTSLTELTHDDLDYMEQWSMTLDLDLFLSSLPQLIGSRDRWHRLSSVT